MASTVDSEYELTINSSREVTESFAVAPSGKKPDILPLSSIIKKALKESKTRKIYYPIAVI